MAYAQNAKVAFLEERNSLLTKSLGVLAADHVTVMALLGHLQRIHSIDKVADPAFWGRHDAERKVRARTRVNVQYDCELLKLANTTVLERIGLCTPLQLEQLTTVTASSSNKASNLEVYHVVASPPLNARMIQQSYLHDAICWVEPLLWVGAQRAGGIGEGVYRRTRDLIHDIEHETSPTCLPPPAGKELEAFREEQQAALMQTYWRTETFSCLQPDGYLDRLWESSKGAAHKRWTNFEAPLLVNALPGAACLSDVPLPRCSDSNVSLLVLSGTSEIKSTSSSDANVLGSYLVFNHPGSDGAVGAESLLSRLRESNACQKLFDIEARAEDLRSRGKEVSSELVEEQAKLQEAFANLLPSCRQISFQDLAAQLMQALCHGAREAPADRNCKFVIVLNFCYSYAVVNEFSRIQSSLPKVCKGSCFFVSVAAKWPSQTTPVILDVCLNNISSTDPDQFSLRKALTDQLSINYDSYKDARMLNGRSEEEAPWVKELRWHTF